MLITEYAIVKLKRDDSRQWVILGQCNDLPGGVRVASIYPIVGMIDEDTGQVRIIPRSHAEGYIDSREEYAYVYWRFFKRDAESVAIAIDTVVVELKRVR
jgi:hypothetical protein